MVLRKHLFALLLAAVLLSCTSLEFNNTCDRKNGEPAQECYSGVEISSSSLGSSSSFSTSSSSSSSYVPSGLCADFDPEAEVKHLDQDKKQLCDERDGNKYVYVTIGTGTMAQTWMAENLNFAASGSKCGLGSYNNDVTDENTVYCDTYGRLYDWNTAKNVCPDGWHLPSKTEWEAMTDNIGGEDTEGKKLKAKNNWYSNNGTDEHGFSALPGGGGGEGMSFSGSYGYNGYWWTSSGNEERDDLAYSRSMNCSYEYAYWNDVGKSALLSVRCVKNN